ncbi:MAG: 50S ribosomal protein L17 [Candidatus Omnitrophota bacterium]
MRHAKARLQLNRFTSWRKATLTSLARALIIHQRIKTTKAKAKAVNPLVEKLVSLGKSNSLSAKRQAFSILGDHRLVSLLFNDIAPRFTNKAGGYTRIINFGSRRGDNAQLVVLAFTEIKEKIRKKPEAKVHKETQKPEMPKQEELPPGEKKAKPETAVKEKPPISKKPLNKFLGGLRGIFIKKSDSL